MEEQAYKVIPPIRAQLAKAAIVVMAATLISRIFGFGREMVMAAYFGAGIDLDAYRAAFILPNLFRMILADVAIGSAFIPVFASYLAKGDKKTAWEVGSNVINLMIITLCVAIGLGIIFAPQLMHLIAPGFVAKGRPFELAIALTRVMFPAILFMALSGVVMGILNSYDHFTAPAIAPVLWNVVIIASVVGLTARLGVFSLALGILAGSLVQFVFQLPFLKGRGGRYVLSLNWRHPGVRQVGVLLVPVMIGLASTDINTIVDTRFASTLITGTVAALGFAVRLWWLPLGIFAIAISTVLFPTLSRQAARGEIRRLVDSLSLGIRLVFLVLIPASVGLMVLGIPIVRLLFERGNFDGVDTILTASALFYYAIGLCAIGQLPLVNRAFYALKDSLTPMIVAVVAIVINYFGDLFLMTWVPKVFVSLGYPHQFWLARPHGGIALSTSVVAFFNFFVLILLLRRRVKGIGGRKILLSLAKIAAASAVLGLVSFYGWRTVAGFVGISLGGQVVSLGVAIVLGIVAFTGVSFILKVEEVHILKALLLRRFSRAHG